jgi:hypothetical protein
MVRGHWLGRDTRENTPRVRLFANPATLTFIATNHSYNLCDHGNNDDTTKDAAPEHEAR